MRIAPTTPSIRTAVAIMCDLALVKWIFPLARQPSQSARSAGGFDRQPADRRRRGRTSGAGLRRRQRSRDADRRAAARAAVLARCSARSGVAAHFFRAITRSSIVPACVGRVSLITASLEVRAARPHKLTQQLGGDVATVTIASDGLANLGGRDDVITRGGQRATIRASTAIAPSPLG